MPRNVAIGVAGVVKLNLSCFCYGALWPDKDSGTKREGDSCPGTGRRMEGANFVPALPLTGAFVERAVGQWVKVVAVANRQRVAAVAGFQSRVVCVIYNATHQLNNTSLFTS